MKQPLLESCTVETGLLRKHPCGHAAVARCLNCEQPLCSQHAVAQLTEAGKRSGKFMCRQCVAALKDHEKSIAAAARAQQDKKVAAVQKPGVEAANAPSQASNKPAAPASTHANGSTAAKPAEPETLEFTPKDGKFEYTRKPDGSGSDHEPG